MTNFTKTFLSAVILLTIISFAMKAQTNVSGGIYNNTTWTKANSPYIITDTVVVFPGVTLTIESGVTVKFADKQELEIRQAELIAMGTATDSITFTSNSNSPTPGIYTGVYLNGGSMPSQIGYCNFYYASTGANFDIDSGFTVKHCKIMNNQDGISGKRYLGSLDSCELKYNIDLALEGFNSVTNCTISNNNTGIDYCLYVNNCVIDSNSNAGVNQSYGPISNCFIRYNNTGISGTLNLYNCVITNNLIGVDNCYTITYCTIDSNSYGVLNPNFENDQTDTIAYCYIEYNDTGFYDQVGSNNYIANCLIEHNNTGIVDLYGGDNVFSENIIDNNSIGIILEVSTDTFYCNSICNNTTYNLEYESENNTNCVANNYWCTTDSAAIKALIYDGYNNVNYGLVNFMPADAIACSGVPTGIPNIETSNFLNIYPNPASNYFTLFVPENSINGRLRIYNLLGELIYTSTILKQETNIDVSALAKGIYIVEVSYGDNVSREKFIKE